MLGNLWPRVRLCHSLVSMWSLEWVHRNPNNCTSVPSDHKESWPLRHLSNTDEITLFCVNINLVAIHKTKKIESEIVFVSQKKVIINECILFFKCLEQRSRHLKNLIARNFSFYRCFAWWLNIKTKSWWDYFCQTKKYYEWK